MLYEVITLDNLLSTHQRPAQMLIEFHHRFADIGKQRTADMIAKLRAAGYSLVFVSLNGREMTFIHRDVV